MSIQNYTTIPHGKIHQLQISDKEIYVLESLLLDTLSNYTSRIADLRKQLCFLFNVSSKDVSSMLSEIQSLEGKIVILNDLARQLDLVD